MELIEQMPMFSTDCVFSRSWYYNFFCGLPLVMYKDAFVDQLHLNISDLEPVQKYIILFQNR